MPIVIPTATMTQFPLADRPAADALRALCRACGRLALLEPGPAGTWTAVRRPLELLMLAVARNARYYGESAAADSRGA